jgi:hypothetical protein
MGDDRTCERCGLPVDDAPCPCRTARLCPCCGEAFDPAADRCLAAALDRIAVLEAENEGLRRPWKIELHIPHNRWVMGFDRYECEICDVGHMDRVMIVELRDEDLAVIRSCDAEGGAR